MPSKLSVATDLTSVAVNTPFAIYGALNTSDGKLIEFDDTKAH